MMRYGLNPPTAADRIEQAVLQVFRVIALAIMSPGMNQLAAALWATA